MDYRTVIVWFFSAVLAGFFVYAIGIDNEFRFDSAVMLVLLWGLYALKDKIRLHPLHFFLFGIFLVLHNLGAFGAYALIPFGLEFDLYVHGFFGIVAALILYRSYALIGPYNGYFLFIAVLIFILGISALHELIEYGGAVLFGEGEGFLFIGAGDHDRFDTQKDMRNNLIGSVFGLLLYKARELVMKK